jgi:NADPH:quinone reductase-like Zn-dependent oxidoreductase
MKALVYKKYGPPSVLQLKEIENPIPKCDEILVRVHATSVNRTDCATIRAKPFFLRIVTGLFSPKRQIPGTEFSGEVEAIGGNVLSFKVGDRVFGFNDEGTLSHAQYLIARENTVLSIPKDLTYEAAAVSFEGAHYAYNFINKVSLKKGNKVLVNGATGAIGSAAVQLLKNYDVDITAVCATKNIDLVKSLGANRVIDYTKSDFTKDKTRYDFVFDTVGKSSFFKCKQSLKPGGAYISSDLGYLWQNLLLPLITPVIKLFLGNKKSVFPTPIDIMGSMLLIKKLIEQGRFNAVIDRVYPLEQIIEAYEYVEKGHKTGNVVIKVEL